MPAARWSLNRDEQLAVARSKCLPWLEDYSLTGRWLLIQKQMEILVRHSRSRCALLAHIYRLDLVNFSSANGVGCVKTPKGRSRRGIVFYRRRGFRVVSQPLATTLMLEKKVILCVQRALAF